MADRRRRTKPASGRSVSTPRSKRAAAASRKNSRKAVAGSLCAELDAVWATIEDAVRACIQRQRWDDLAAAVTAYAALLRLDPSVLLHVALIRAKAREALTLTDPAEQRHYAEQLRVSLAFGMRPQTLTEAIGHVRSAVEHRPAFEAFDALGGTVCPEAVH